MLNVIGFELKHRRTAIIWWLIGSIIMALVILALYPSIRDQAAQLNKVINSLPPELRGLKTGGSSTVNVADPLEFLNSQLFYATLPIMWIILAITRGSAILGRDEQQHTLELLLARPMSRSRLLLAKATAFGLECDIVMLLTGVLILVAAPAFQLHVSSVNLLLATLYTTLFSVSFGYIAFVLQAASKLTKRGATAAAVALGFGGYVIASLSSLTDWLKTPSKLLPYHYFNPLDILNGKPPRGLLLYLGLVFVLGTFVAVTGFRRRDIE